MPTRITAGRVPESLLRAARASVPGGARMTDAALIRAGLAALAKVDLADHPMQPTGRPKGARTRRRQSGDQAAA
jgi:hypothetical protein